MGEKKQMVKTVYIIKSVFLQLNNESRICSMYFFKQNKTKQTNPTFFVLKVSDFFFCLESKKFALFKDTVVEEELVGNGKGMLEES